MPTSEVDPNPGLGSLAHGRIASSPIAVDWQVADAQELPFPNQSFDSVASTWTSCSMFGQLERFYRKNWV